MYSWNKQVKFVFENKPLCASGPSFWPIVCTQFSSLFSFPPIVSISELAPTRPHTKLKGEYMSKCSIVHKIYHTFILSVWRALGLNTGFLCYSQNPVVWSVFRCNSHIQSFPLKKVWQYNHTLSKLCRRISVIPMSRHLHIHIFNVQWATWEIHHAKWTLWSLVKSFAELSKNQTWKAVSSRFTLSHGNTDVKWQSNSVLNLSKINRQVHPDDSLYDSVWISDKDAMITQLASSPGKSISGSGWISKSKSI